MTSSGKNKPQGAVILAGGLSRRMGGRHKALLPLRGATFLQVLLDLYENAGVSERLVITHRGVTGDPDFPALPDAVDLMVLDQAAPSPLHTLWAALDPIENRWSSFFMHPVDHPYVLPETIRRMREVMESGDKAIIQACHDGRGGHPVLIDLALAGEIRNASPDQGLRQVVRAEPGRVLRLAVPDPGVLRGVNYEHEHRSQ